MVLGWSALIRGQALVFACLHRRWRSSLGGVIYSIGVAFSSVAEPQVSERHLALAASTAAAACHFAGVFQAIGR